MNEYTIHIDSREGLATDEGLTVMHDELSRSDVAHGAAVGFDGTDAYGATFQVNALTISDAAALAAKAFGDALAAAGHTAGAIAHVDVVEDAVAA